MALLDHVADPSGQVQVDGFDLTVTSFAQRAKQVCADVKYVDPGGGPYDLLLDWTIRQPNGVAKTPNPNAYISAGDLPAGGSTSGPVCFDSTGQHGQFVLLWQSTSVGRSDRGVWLLPLP